MKRYEVVVRPIYQMSIDAESKKEAENQGRERVSTLLDSDEMPIWPKAIAVKAVKSVIQPEGIGT